MTLREKICAEGATTLREYMCLEIGSSGIYETSYQYCELVLSEQPDIIVESDELLLREVDSLAIGLEPDIKLIESEVKINVVC